MIKSFVFDVDGVLVDSKDALARAYSEALQATGMPDVPLEKISMCMGMELHEWARNIVPRELRSDDKLILKISQEVVKRYEGGYVETAGLYPDVKNALEYLQQEGYTLGVATNNIHDTAMGLLARLDILRFFDVVSTLTESKRPKPEPDIVLYALDKLECDTASAFFVGDSPTDMIAGQKAGVKTVLVNRAWNAGYSQELRVDSLIELAKLKI